MFRVPRFVTTCSLSSGDAAVSRAMRDELSLVR